MNLYYYVCCLEIGLLTLDIFDRASILSSRSLSNVEILENFKEVLVFDNLPLCSDL